MSEGPKSQRPKPVGHTGPIHLTPEGMRRQLVAFPADKDARERMIAEMFMGNIARFDAEVGPLSNLVQNDENDLDFTVQTSAGPKLLELAEFAPLSTLGVRYETAPRQISMSEFAALYHQLIINKSAHQGGPDRLLLTYRTHDAFTVSPPVVELVRRRLQESPPSFERVYFLSPHDATGATIFNVYPGRPHSFFTDMSDEQLASIRLHRVDFDEIRSDPPANAAAVTRDIDR